MSSVRRSALGAALVGAIAIAGPASVRGEEGPGSLHEVGLPGGLPAALVAIDDRVAADRGQFLLEFIRRTYGTPQRTKRIKDEQRSTGLPALLAHLDRLGRMNQPSTGSAETLPLPLPPRIWIDSVFGGAATEDTLLSAILRSRRASLLYYGLMSLDDITRAWLTTQPELIAGLSERQSAAFVFAAPGLHIADTAIDVPGGAVAAPVWEALVGRRVDEPAAFVRALLSENHGRLAYFFGAIAQLSPAEMQFALHLDSPDEGERIAAARRLYGVFERIARGWKLEQRTFWRPALDPGLLVADLRVDDTGRPVVPGTAPFWSAVLARDGRGEAKDDPQAITAGEPVDFAWLCEQVFRGGVEHQRRRYELVLFASRILREVTPATARDSVEAVRAAATSPALAAVLERAGLEDVATIASAARRAARLSAIGDEKRAFRAMAQFQGLLALVTRAAVRGSLPPDSVSHLVRSLSAVDLSERGDYEGRLVRWVDVHLREVTDPAVHETPISTDAALSESPTVPVDQDLLRLLAGPVVIEPRALDWEGTRYRLDLTSAEATRLGRLIGEDRRPYLSSARRLLEIADVLGSAGRTREDLMRQAEALADIAQALAWEGAGSATGPRSAGGRPEGKHRERANAPPGYRQVSAALRRAASTGDARAAAGLAPALRLLADDVLARRLLELAYAAALGQPQHDRASISARDIARRHDFGFRSRSRQGGDPWSLPSARTDRLRGWHVTGSLLGLDVKLAELSLTRVSTRPLSRRPTLNSEDRRVFIEAVALIGSPPLLDADRDAIVAAVRRGRARLAEVRTPEAALALADEIRLSSMRRTLLPWVVKHDPDRLPSFLSPSELLSLGLENRRVAARLHVWGAPGGPRLGCLCLQLMDRPWETLAGRWPSGMLATGFPDLNLRLAELLAELQMPAPLLGPVLASATLDFIDAAASRDMDDRRGLVEFVQTLSRERVEQYLALLTTDGPLVPIGDAVEPVPDAEVRR